MADFPTQARVVIIGGGAVGASCLYHLAKAGWTDTVLLEKNELTSGSTWHAAGNCPNFAGSWSIMKMQNYSTRMYATLAEDVDYPINYHVTGAVRLAHSEDRMDEFRHVSSMARYQGIDIHMMTNEEMKSVYPFLETHDLVGGLWDETDGDLDPAQLTQALAKGARDLGARVVRFAPVTAINRLPGGEWDVVTPKGTMRAEIIVNAAGYRAAEIGRMIGREIPEVALSHQYLVTEDVPELAGLDKKIPLLRDPDSSYYLRQEGGGLLLGPYEFDARAYWHTAADPMPEDFSFQLWNDDLDRLEWYIDDACKRVPILGTAGIKRVINGPIPYAGDGLPLIGPTPGIPNAFEACTFTFGIVQAGGAGKILTEWVTEGETEWDMWSVDPRRYTEFATKSYTVAKAIETYSHEYAMHPPHHEWPAGRPAFTSPLYEKLKAKGARFSSRGGWEKPTWYGEPGAEDPPENWHHGVWFEPGAEESRAVMEDVGICDLTAFGRFELKGPRAAAWLETMITGALPKPGRIILAYFCDNQGRILTEMTLNRFSEDHFWLLTAAGAIWHDMDWLNKHMPADAAFTIEDITQGWGTLMIAGPKARDVLSQVVANDLSNEAFPWLTHQPVSIGMARGTMIRVNYVGELGWELHLPLSTMVGAYDLIWAAGEAHGIRDFGVYAMESMRIEKCYRSWKADLSTDYTGLMGGLDRFIRLNKPEFIGRQALLEESQTGRTEKFAPLIVEAGTADAPYLATVWQGDDRVGLVTSGGYGHRVGKSIALAHIRTDLAEPGTELEVGIFGERCKAVVTTEPIYDPENARLKA